MSRNDAPQFDPYYIRNHRPGLRSSGRGVHRRTMSWEDASMLSHEKFQKGRGWAYLAGIVIVVVVAAWKFVAR
jgi:hypothetical protein